MSKIILARSQTLTHPLGVKLTTPLLIPSFSSKGLPPSTEVGQILETTAEWLTDTMLISAYDVHHREIAPPEELPCMPELTMVDSGGYEAGFDEDISIVGAKDHAPKPWTTNDLKNVLDAWPERFPAVFVSYDHPTRRLPLAEQVSEAKKLLQGYSRQMHSFLLKPSTKEQKHSKTVLHELIAEPDAVAAFDVVGVTEKELGSSMLDRMQRIAELRLALDRANFATPIQVFGALDPISACLYFISGAEIFDGLTWLRYAYLDGVCVYRANYGALKIGLGRRDLLLDAKTMVDNINYLQQLEHSMRRVALDRDIDHFPHHTELLQRGFDDLRTRLKGRV